MNRTCYKCKEVKPLEMFVKCGKGGVKGRMYRCKKCQSIMTTERHKKDPKRKDYMREWWRKTKLNMPPIDYHGMLKEQDGKCAICGKADEKKSLAVDHCHATNKWRGLLCNNCNLGLGHFKDNIDALNGAIKYLIKHSEGEQSSNCEVT